MNMNVSDRLRCAYEECAEAHPLANESTYEQVTCLTCRAALGLPPIEIYKNSGATVAATPKPRAGEHVRWADQYDFDRSDPATRLFVAASNWVDRCEAAEAERDSLREALQAIVSADIRYQSSEIALRAHSSNQNVVEQVTAYDLRQRVIEQARALLAKHGR